MGKLWQFLGSAGPVLLICGSLVLAVGDQQSDLRFGKGHQPCAHSQDRAAPKWSQPRAVYRHAAGVVSGSLLVRLGQVWPGSITRPPVLDVHSVVSTWLICHSLPSMSVSFNLPFLAGMLARVRIERINS